MQPQQFTAKLEDKIEFNDKYSHFFFELIKPSRMDFLSGQYVSMPVDDQGTRRSYSICSSPDINHGFELLVDVEPQGKGTSLLKNLKFGEQINILAPLGRFVLSENLDHPVVFVATGCGIAPLRSMILDLLQVKRTTLPVTLYWGMRYAHHLFWLDEFQDLAESFANFNFSPVLSRPEKDWKFSRGHVTDLLATDTNFVSNADFYLCGSNQMIQDVSKILQKKKVLDDRIHYEKFF